MPDTLGPFETEREASALPQVRAIYDVMNGFVGTVTISQRQAVDTMSSALITDECDRAGVVLGAYDRRIVGWMANWEPEMCAVVAGLVRRAHEAGRKSAS